MIVPHANDASPARTRATGARAARLVSIDVLRGIAALAVVCVHIRDTAPAGSEGGPLFAWARLMEFGYLGVPLFILISGFCIHLGTARRMAQGEPTRARWGEFWFRRFQRLYPPYLAAMVLSTAIAWCLGMGTAKEFPFHIDLATHLAMVHNLTLEYYGGMGNGAYWSLGLEEQLYLLYFGYLALRRRWRLMPVLGAVAVVALCWAAARMLLPESVPLGERISLGAWWGWPFRFWIMWVLGAVAAEAYAGCVPLPRWCTDLRAALGMIALATLLNYRVLDLVVAACGLDGSPGAGVVSRACHEVSEYLFPLAFFVILCRWVLRETEGRFAGRWVEPLARAGKISYSLYLVHLPTIILLHRLFPLDASPASWAIRTLTFIPACLLAATLFYLGVERWFLRKHPVARAGRPCS